VDVRTVAVCAVTAAATLAIALLSLASGDYKLSLAQVVAAFTHDGFAHTVVVEWRAPRVLATIVFGAALGVSGAIFQSLTRNPLASPDVIGFSTGSYTGALVVITVLGGGSYLGLAGGALAGGIATAAVVYVLAYKNGIQGFRLIVVGIAISAMLASVNTYLLLVSDHDAAISAAVWGAGSLSATTWSQVGLGGAVIGLLLVATARLSRPLRQLELGDDAAAASGVRAEPARLALTLVGVALTAAVTASAGPIAFVALAAPQVARRLTRAPGVALTPAAFTGAFVLCAADYGAEHLLATAVPVGVVTVVIGGAYLIWLLIGEARRRS
jgi:iron complex transport system permease protein